MRIWGNILIAVFIFAALAARSFAAEIIYTGCMHGQLENCHCPEDPLGAMEKQAAEINKRREINSDLLLFCSGDFMPPTVDAIAPQYIIEAMKYTGYDAVTLGDQELIQGSDYLKQLFNSLNVVSANLVNKKGKFLTKRYREFERGGKKLFVTGITHPRALKFIDQDILPENVELLEMNQALRTTLEKAPEDAFIILLSHSGVDIDELIAEDFPEIDLIVGGHSQTRLDSQIKVGNVSIVQAGGSGRYIGIAEVKSDGISTELMPMQPTMPDDDFIIEQVLKLKSARKRSK